MPNQHQPAGPYVRRTARLTGSIARTEAKLDLAAQLGIAYGQKWLEQAQGQSALAVPASGVIRRALQVYMGHLNAASTDPAEEARAALRCCNATPADEETRRSAFARLDAVTEGQPLPAFGNVLWDPGLVAAMTGLDARVEELVGQINEQRHPRRNRAAS
jgi:hypothetical protein